MRYRIIKVAKIFFLLIILFLSGRAVAQTIDVNAITDDQLQVYVAKAKASGLTEDQLYALAAQKGMSAADIDKLKARIAKLNSAPQAAPVNTDPSKRLDVAPRDSSTQLNETTDQRNERLARSKIFGSGLFSNNNLTFEPNLRIATPRNYVIGPDDEIDIDLTGDNEASYKLTVGSEGTIRVEFAGIIAVNGFTVEQATAKIKARLSQTYPAIRSGKTKLTVSIGNIRSIKVTLLGEVVKPGTYTLSSLATVFNALYASGGPSKDGSFRAIELIRNNHVIQKLDVYDFLVKGYQTNNVRLEDQDVIRVPVYKVRAEISGEIKHPAIFELLPNQTLNDILDYAGGFSDMAYKAKIKVLENTDKEQRVSDVSAADYKTYIPKNGDKYFVEPILDRIENRVILKGAVFRPGQFELQPGLTLSRLISNADGIKEDAFLTRGYLLRLQPDNTTQLVSFNLGAILNKSQPDIPLQREDQVTVLSIFDLKDQFKVSVNGEVRNGGEFDYAEGMNLQDLILLAGGLTQGASPKLIEIARRVTDSDANSFSSKAAEIYHIDLSKNLDFSGIKFMLKPFDMVTVRNNTGYNEQRQVKVEGEVLHPGFYIIADKNERISDLVKRSGGLTPLGYIPGASLKRSHPETGSGINKVDLSHDQSVKVNNLERLQADLKDSTNVNIAQELKDNSTVGIDLADILKNPGRDNDLILEEGDVLRIPKQLQTVKINGEVLYPVTAVFKDGSGFKYYISQAGGFTGEALRKHGYVVYANGSVDNTKHFLFFTSYPKVTPGAEIFIPKQAPETGGTSALTVISISTAIASLGAIILGILKL